MNKKAFDLLCPTLAILSFLISLSIIESFGALIHETGHALACLLLGLPFYMTSTSVVYAHAHPNSPAGILVGLAGGLLQALFSLILFWFATIWEKKVLFKKASDFKRLKLFMVFGAKVGFLTMTFKAAINGILEGLFYQSYLQIHSDATFWARIIFICGIISFIIFFKSFHINLLKNKEKKKENNMHFCHL